MSSKKITASKHKQNTVMSYTHLARSLSFQDKKITERHLRLMRSEYKKQQHLFHQKTALLFQKAYLFAEHTAIKNKLTKHMSTLENYTNAEEQFGIINYALQHFAKYLTSVRAQLNIYEFITAYFVVATTLITKLCQLRQKLTHVFRQKYKKLLFIFENELSRYSIMLYKALVTVQETETIGSDYSAYLFEHFESGLRTLKENNVNQLRKLYETIEDFFKRKKLIANTTILSNKLQSIRSLTIDTDKLIQQRGHIHNPVSLADKQRLHLLISANLQNLLKFQCIQAFISYQTLKDKYYNFCRVNDSRQAAAILVREIDQKIVADAKKLKRKQKKHTQKQLKKAKEAYLTWKKNKRKNELSHLEATHTRVDIESKPIVVGDSPLDIIYHNLDKVKLSDIDVAFTRVIREYQIDSKAKDTCKESIDIRISYYSCKIYVYSKIINRTAKTQSYKQIQKSIDADIDQLENLDSDSKDITTLRLLQLAELNLLRARIMLSKPVIKLKKLMKWYHCSEEENINIDSLIDENTLPFQEALEHIEKAHDHVTLAEKESFSDNMRSDEQTILLSIVTNDIINEKHALQKEEKQYIKEKYSLERVHDRKMHSIPAKDHNHSNNKSKRTNFIRRLKDKLINDNSQRYRAIEHACSSILDKINTHSQPTADDALNNRGGQNTKINHKTLALFIHGHTKVFTAMNSAVKEKFESKTDLLSFYVMGSAVDDLVSGKNSRNDIDFFICLSATGMKYCAMKTKSTRDKLLKEIGITINTVLANSGHENIAERYRYLSYSGVTTWHNVINTNGKCDYTFTPALSKPPVRLRQRVYDVLHKRTTIFTCNETDAVNVKHDHRNKLIYFALPQGLSAKAKARYHCALEKEIQYYLAQGYLIHPECVDKIVVMKISKSCKLKLKC